jgi:hypothetical protein
MESPTIARPSRAGRPRSGQLGLGWNLSRGTNSGLESWGDRIDYEPRSCESAQPSETADLLAEKLDKAIYCPTALTTKQTVTDIVF